MSARGLDGARCLVSANFRKSPKPKRRAGGSRGVGGGSQARKKKKKKRNSYALLPAGGRAPMAARRPAGPGAGEPADDRWRVERPPPHNNSHTTAWNWILNLHADEPQGAAETPQNCTEDVCLSVLSKRGHGFSSGFLKPWKVEISFPDQLQLAVFEAAYLVLGGSSP